MPALKNGADRSCTVCGKGFYIPRNRLVTAKFCSHACSKVGMRPSRVARGEAKRKHHRTCKICGKAPLNGARKEYCSWACYQRGKSEERVKDGRAKCAKCGEWKPLSECVRGVNGRPHSYCKPCVSVWFHERRGKPAEQRRPYRARYTLTEEEKALNRRLGSMLNKKRRAAAGPWPSAQELRQLVLAQESRCAYCLVELDRGFHFDHKLPIARGGTNSISNLQATCAKCNQTKHTMTHEEYLVSKKRKVTEWVQPISETTHECRARKGKKAVCVLVGAA